jgi:hypothetical protein
MQPWTIAECPTFGVDPRFYQGSSVATMTRNAGRIKTITCICAQKGYASETLEAT